MTIKNLENRIKSIEKKLEKGRRLSSKLNHYFREEGDLIRDLDTLRGIKKGLERLENTLKYSLIIND